MRSASASLDALPGVGLDRLAGVGIVPAAVHLVLGLQHAGNGPRGALT